MVNKCSSITCKNQYSRNHVIHHRFPLKNKKTLQHWISFTGRPVYWWPTKSSRLCSEHFLESDYMEEHGKFKLKPTAIPTIEILTIGSEDGHNEEEIIMDGVEDNIYEINVCTVADTLKNVYYYFSDSQLRELSRIDNNYIPIITIKWIDLFHISPIINR